jgi:hypothetical protein
VGWPIAAVSSLENEAGIARIVRREYGSRVACQWRVERRCVWGRALAKVLFVHCQRQKPKFVRFMENSTNSEYCRGQQKGFCGGQLLINIQLEPHQRCT